MEYRGQESPMEFEWENQTGRVDTNSPFRMSGIQRAVAEETPVRRGGAPSSFQSSPIKHEIFSTPAPSQPVFMKQSAHPATPLGKPLFAAFNTPAFQTPRNTFDTPSKDSDMFSTPGNDSRDMDSEVPTPDVQLAQLLRSGKKGGISSLSLSGTRVTGRGELRRGTRHDGAISKPQRRRNKRAEPDKTSNDDESDEVQDNYSTRGQPPRKARSTREWLETHRGIPEVVSSYLQMFIHASWVLLAIYILFSGVRVVQQDLNNRLSESVGAVTAKIQRCSSEYVVNHCAPHTRVPKLAEFCAELEKCMNEDPNKVGRSAVSATMLAQILNSFVSELHWKTMGSIIFLITLCWVAGRSTGSTKPYFPHPFYGATPSFPSSTPHTYPYQSPRQWKTPVARSEHFDLPSTPLDYTTSPRKNRDNGQALEWRD